MYMYDTMHLTEFAVIFDYGLDRKGKRRHQGTNAIHPGLLRKVYRMAIAIPKFTQERCEWPPTRIILLEMTTPVQYFADARSSACAP